MTGHVVGGVIVDLSEQPTRPIDPEDQQEAARRLRTTQTHTAVERPRGQIRAAPTHIPGYTPLSP